MADRLTSQTMPDSVPGDTGINPGRAISYARQNRAPT